MSWLTLLFGFAVGKNPLTSTYVLANENKPVMSAYCSKGKDGEPPTKNSFSFEFGECYYDSISIFDSRGVEHKYLLKDVQDFLVGQLRGIEKNAKEKNTSRKVGLDG